MSFRECLTRSLVHLGMWALALVASLVILNATTTTLQLEKPAGVQDCYDRHTARIFTVAGECPVYAPMKGGRP